MDGVPNNKTRRLLVTQTFTKYNRWSQAREQDLCAACTRGRLVIKTEEVGHPMDPLRGMYTWAPPFIGTPFRCGRPEYCALSRATHVLQLSSPETLRVQVRF